MDTIGARLEETAGAGLRGIRICRGKHTRSVRNVSRLCNSPPPTTAAATHVSSRHMVMVPSSHDTAIRRCCGTCSAQHRELRVSSPGTGSPRSTPCFLPPPPFMRFKRLRSCACLMTLRVAASETDTTLEDCFRRDLPRNKSRGTTSTSSSSPCFALPLVKMFSDRFRAASSASFSFSCVVLTVHTTWSVSTVGNLPTQARQHQAPLHALERAPAFPGHWHSANRPARRPSFSLAWVCSTGRQ